MKEKGNRNGMYGDSVAQGEDVKRGRKLRVLDSEKKAKAKKEDPMI